MTTLAGCYDNKPTHRRFTGTRFTLDDVVAMSVRGDGLVSSALTLTHYLTFDIGAQTYRAEVR